MPCWQFSPDQRISDWADEDFCSAARYGGKSWAHLGVIWSPRCGQGPASSISLGVPPWQNNNFPDSAQQLFWLHGNSWGWHASPLLPLDTQGAWGTAEAWVEGEEVSGAPITEFTLAEAVVLRDLPPTPLKPARVNTASDSRLGGRGKGLKEKTVRQMLKDPKASEMHWVDSPAHCTGGESKAPNQTLYRNLIVSALRDSVLGDLVLSSLGGAWKVPTQLVSSMPHPPCLSWLFPLESNHTVWTLELGGQRALNSPPIQHSLHAPFKATTSHLSIFPNLFCNKGNSNTFLSTPGCMLKTWVHTSTRIPDTRVHSCRVHNGPRPGKD